MRISCERCQAVYTVDDALLMAGPIKAQCPACQNIQVVQATDPPGSQGPAVPEAQDPFEDLHLPPPVPSPPPLPMPVSTIGRPPPLPGAPESAGMPPLPELDVPVMAPLPDPFAGDRSAFDQGEGPGAEAAAVPPTERRCERCGGVVGPGPEPLCARCRQLADQRISRIDEGREWRVQKPDGVILGPLTQLEVKQKYQQGEVSAADRLARGEGDFRLISSYPEFAVFFRRPGEGLQASFRHPPRSHALRNGLLFLLLLAVGAAVALYFLWPRLLAMREAKPMTTAVEEAFETFANEITSPSGDPAALIRQGWDMSLRDERVAYMEADRAFKTALLLEPSSLEALAGWVQNRALLDFRMPDVRSRKVALDLIEFGLERSPQMPELLRSKAFLFLSLGHVTEARDLAMKALLAKPEDPISQLALGASYLESSSEMAVELLEKALAADSHLRVAYRFLGEAKMRLGSFREALKYFKERLDKDPGQFETINAMAQVYLAVGQYSRARELYELILGTEPDRVEAVVALARIESQVEDNPRAGLRFLETFLQKAKPENKAARALVLAEKANLLRLLGRLDEAVATADEAVGLDPFCGPALYWQAALTQEHGDPAVALARLRELRAHLPESTRVVARMALAEWRLPNSEAAFQHLRQATEMAPNDFDIQLVLSILYLDMDNPNQAFANLKQVGKLDPFYDQDHHQLTPYYDGPQWLQQVVPRALAALERHGDEPLAQAMVGILLWRAGQTDKARFRLLQALEQDSECTLANVYLGVLAIEHGQWAKASDALGKAHRTDPLLAVAARLYARALSARGKAAQAEKILRPLIKSDPGDLATQRILAEVLLARGKKAQAVKLLHKVYLGDNDNVAAKHGLFMAGF